MSYAHVLISDLQRYLVCTIFARTGLVYCDGAGSAADQQGEVAEGEQAAQKRPKTE